VIGSTIDGKYLVKSLLGEGGMGSVFEVEHTGTGRRCAVKVINSGDLTRDEQILSRFEREARAAGAIDTQYITQVLDAGLDRESGRPFMAMEFLEGEDLQKFLKRVGPIGPELALRIVAQACLGLSKAHAANVVHRDIKPHNLFLARRDAGEVVIKLLDFGIAKVKMDQAQTREGADLTKTGNLLGSPLYVSPEQARGKRQIDHRTDVYSLGAVLYQMLCGRTPYEHATALGELILMVCTEPAASVQDHAPWVPPEIARICHRCLQKNPDDRYPSADALFADIRALLPNGWGIHQDMLVSLADSQRHEQAPRLPMSVPPPAFESGRYDAMTSAQAAAAGGDAASTTGPLVRDGTPAPSSQVPASMAASGGSRAVPIVLAAAAVLGLGAVGAWAFTRPPDTSASVAAVPSADEAPPAASPAPAPEPDPPPAVENKRVKVAIRPADADVEVEGAATKLMGDGYLELNGPPGKVFKVHVAKGPSEADAEVIITESGPFPPIIELKVGQKIKISHADAVPAKTPDPAPLAAPPPGIKVDDTEFD
jgi:eukaryotic-like serine/threonine-protein kinase